MKIQEVKMKWEAKTLEMKVEQKKKETKAIEIL